MSSDFTDKMRPEHLVAIGVEACLEYGSPAAVFVPTHAGSTARSIARFRFPVWTVAVCTQESTCRRLQLSSGVYPVHEPDHPETWKDFAEHWLKENDMADKFAIVTEGPSTKHPEMNHRMEIIDLRPKPRRGNVG